MSSGEHSPTRPAVSALRRARSRFLSGRPLPEDVPDEIAAAWRRARFFGVAHDLVPAGPRQPVPSPHLLRVARPVLERLAPVLASAGRPAMLLLTDERLRVLWSAGDLPGDVPACRDLSEREVGHNSAALALRTRSRAEAHGPEHFLDLWQDVSAVSVPVPAPDGERVLGTVTVVSGLCAGCAPHPCAALAEATAAAVEAELRLRERERNGPAERVLLDAYQRAAARPGAAVAAFDGRNRLLNEAAEAMLSPRAVETLERDAAASGADASDTGADADGARADADGADASGTGTDGTGTGATGASDTGTGDTGTGGTGTGDTGTGDTGAGGTGAGGTGAGGTGAGDAGTFPSGSYDLRLPDGAGTARLTPVRHRGAVVGVVAVLGRAHSPGPSAGRAVRTPAASAVNLAGRSVPWLLASARAAELTRAGGPLLLTGERGTGKTSLARELLTAREDTDLLVVDAARNSGDALTAWAGAPADDRVLLLRHAERLAQSDVAVLNSLLGARPDAPLLVTYTPGAVPGPCLRRLLDMLAARSVTLPALRERPDDIKDLLARLAPRPAPGEPPLTWTLDALRALEQYPWPGNVTELAHLVGALARQRRAAGPVRRAELPDPVREGSGVRRMSAMESAERTAILEALRRHGGNKARAAASLGIARATLYRKLRGYRA
ncbi:MULTISPECIES: helix-turn-helix domain-containing protein [Streptomyces]|uniref:helix-turn-helix domain-containing protein n=1 Tax=Streptomyces TaxID=1883 RepID=UPI001E42F759|nr:helix-turn-helix domain-containing protein [Streptomyces ruber]